VRLVRQLRAELGTEHGTVKRVADQLGYGVETVRKWVRQADVGEGLKAGRSAEDEALIRELTQRNRELERANKILKKASAGSRGQCNISSRTVAGVRNPRVLRGRVLSFAATASRSA